MVSPTQLCWRYHSLPLSQRIILWTHNWQPITKSQCCTHPQRMGVHPSSSSMCLVHVNKNKNHSPPCQTYRPTHTATSSSQLREQMCHTLFEPMVDALVAEEYHSVLNWLQWIVCLCSLGGWLFNYICHIDAYVHNFDGKYWTIAELQGH